MRNATLLKALLSWREAALEQQAARQAVTKVRRAAASRAAAAQRWWRLEMLRGAWQCS
jgi:hypothetical protein